MRCGVVLLDTCRHAGVSGHRQWRAGFRVGVIQSLGLVAPGSAGQLRRVVHALQHSLMWDAATPSHCHVISVAAVNAAADLSRGFPPCRPSLQELLAGITASPELAPPVRIAAADAELHLDGASADAVCGALVTLLSGDRIAQETAAILSAAALLLSSEGQGDGEQEGMREVPPDTLAVLRTELQAHSTPSVRHEAYRALCAVMGQPPSLVQMAQEGMSEHAEEGTAQRAPPAHSQPDCTALALSAAPIQRHAMPHELHRVLRRAVCHAVRLSVCVPRGGLIATSTLPVRLHHRV